MLPQRTVKDGQTACEVKNIEYEENNLFDGADAVRVSARRRDVGLCAGTDSALDFGIFTERHFGAFHGHLLSGGGERDGD